MASTTERSSSTTEISGTLDVLNFYARQESDLLNLTSVEASTVGGCLLLYLGMGLAARRDPFGHVEQFHN